MKKRLISILLTVLMVMSLFSGMSVSAYADNDVSSDLYTEYALKEGDWVAKVCFNLGVDYYGVKEAIMLLNGISTEAQFSRLPVGKVIKIPNNGADAAEIVSILKNVSGTTSSNGTASGSTIVGGSANTGTDPVAYYLIAHTMQAGETVLGVCNTLGISFTDNQNLIKTLNNISSWNRVNAGKTILIPSLKTPSVGTTCYAVLAHKIVSGDTAYTICQQNGISYNANLQLLQALNPTTSMTNIKKGATLLVPVPTVIQAVTNPGTGSGGNSGSTTSPSPTPTGTPEPSAAPEYKLTSSIAASDGSVRFTVDGEIVTSAKQGDKVTVEVLPLSGKAVDSVTVKYADGSADLKMSSNTFVMPACDIRVDATIKSGYDITINSNYPNKTAAAVNNVSVTSAVKGRSVQIISIDPGYVVDTLNVYTVKSNGDRDTIKVNSDNCFNMPGQEVIIDVTLSTVKTYNISTTYAHNGGFDLQVNGNSVTKAAKGTEVKVVAQPNSGYELYYVEVKQGSTNIKVSGDKFIMPEGDVSVSVAFVSKTNAITFESIIGGELAAYANSNLNKTIKEIEEGETVWVQAINQDAGYGPMKSITVRKAVDGVSTVTTTKVANGVYTFVMPRGGVVVSGELDAEKVYVAVTFDPDTKGVGNTVTLSYNGNTKTIKDTTPTSGYNISANIEVSLGNTPNEAYAFGGYTILVGGVKDDGLTDLANSTGRFVLPAKTVTIKAKFSADAMSLPAAAITSEVKGTVSYLVSAGGTAGWETTNACNVNDVVKIVCTDVTNYTVTKDSVQVIDGAGNPVEVSSDLTFTVPKDGIKSVSVAWTGAEHNVKLFVKDITQGAAEAGLMGKSKVGINGIDDNNNAGTVVKVNSGDKVTVVLNDGDYEIVAVKLLEAGTSTSAGFEAAKEEDGKYSFTMVDRNLDVQVELKAKSQGLSVEYDKSLATVGFAIGDIKAAAATSAQVGDKVFVVANDIKDGYEFSGITITTKVGNVKFAEGDGTGTTYKAETGGWSFTMPKGGVDVKVDIAVKNYSLKVVVVDENGTKVTGDGLVAINSQQVDATGVYGNVSYGDEVSVSLTELASDYKISSVTAQAGSNSVEVKKNKFTMPTSNVTVTVTLVAK